MMRARDDTSTSEGQVSGYLKVGFWIFLKNMFLGASWQILVVTCSAIKKTIREVC